MLSFHVKDICGIASQVRKRHLLAATEARTEITTWHVVLLVKVTATAVLTVAATTATTETVTVTHHGTLRTSWLLVRVGHNLRGQVQVLTQVLETLVREHVVEPLPAELRVHVALRGERLHGLDHFQVWRIQDRVLDLKVLRCHEHTFLEQGRVDGAAVLLRNDHRGDRGSLEKVVGQWFGR